MVRIFRREKGSRPVTSPPRTVKTGPSGTRSLRARISPSSMTSMLSAGSPSFMIMPPTAARCSLHLEPNQSRSSCGKSENTEMPRSFAMSSSGGDFVEISVMRALLLAWSASLNLCQILVHELHDHGAFADAGSDALDGAVADIAYDKNSRHIRFEQPRIAIQCPGRRPLPRVQQVRSGKNEAALVALYGAAKPFRTRLGADENEQA